MTEIKRTKCSEASPYGWAPMVADGYYRDQEWNEIFVTHDGKSKDTDARQCTFAELPEQLEFVSQSRRRIAVVIDNQPTFHAGRKFSPVKPEIVEKAIQDAKEFGGKKLAIICIVE